MMEAVSTSGDYHIAGVGELLWDLLPEGRKLGGAPANFAYHVQMLGGRASMVSCVGDDDSGSELLACLSSKGLDVSGVGVDREHPTGSVSVTVHPGGKPEYEIHRNVAWDFIPWSDTLHCLAGGLDAVCFGSLAQRCPVSRETIQLFLDHLRPDCLVIFDINIRQHYYSPEVVERSLHRSDVLKLNDDELPILSNMFGIAGDTESIIGSVIEKFDLQMVALTRGDKGSLLLTPEGRADHPGFPPERIIDTVGAGDSFTAALALGILEKLSLESICTRANRVASFVCTQEGGMPDYPRGLMDDL